MTTEALPQLHAVSAEPRVVRAGGCVDLVFRTRNLGSAPTPPAVVRFALDDGLEPLGDTAVAVEPVAPGEHVVARVRVRVPCACEDRTHLTASASLATPDATYAANACTIVVRSRPVLDGPQSGARVELLDQDRVRVHVAVTNEGDGPAHDVRVSVPAPDGCERSAARDAATIEIDTLAPGARREAAFDAHIVAPVREVRAEGGTVRWHGGRSAVVPARNAVVLAPRVAMPVVTLRTERRRVDVSVELRNEGWADARDVVLDVAFPDTVRLIEGSVAADGVPAMRCARLRAPAFARVASGRGRCTIAIASIPPRDGVRTALSLAAAAGAHGDVVASIDGRSVRAPFAVTRDGEVRLRIVPAQRRTAPGERSVVAAELVNASDDAVELSCTATIVDGAGEAPRVRCVLAGTSVARIELPLLVPPDASGALRFAVVAYDGDRERARATGTLDVCAHSAALDAEYAERESGAGDADAAPHVEAALSVPDDAVACGAFAVRLTIVAYEPVERLTVRASLPDGARYAAGSCTVDGAALLDPSADDASPLDGDGIALCGIAGGSRIVVAWSLTALDAASTVTVAATVDADGAAVTVSSANVTIVPRGPFAVRPAQLPYHVDGAGIVALPAAVPVPDEEDAEPPSYRDASPAYGLAPASHDAAPLAARDDARGPFVIRFDDQRVDAIRRLHRVLREPGLAAHAFAVRLFFPDADGAPLDETCRAVRDALDDLYDRVYVKLRIPGFGLTCDDLDDARLRESAAALFAGLGDASPCAPREGAGSPRALRAMAGLVGTARCADPALADALAAHAAAFGAALARYDDAPLADFDDALRRCDDASLDTARDTLLAALRPYVRAEGAAC